GIEVEGLGILVEDDNEEVEGTEVEDSGVELKEMKMVKKKTEEEKANQNIQENQIYFMRKKMKEGKSDQ
ncbi:unnamed protein product, partial [Citrullus colocynthis]